MKYLEKLKKFSQSNWGTLLLFAAVCFAVMSPVLILHKTTFFVNLDNVDQFYTWYQKLAISWHRGYLPIWNANVYAGSSFAGELQQGVFYPINWVWVALFGNGQGISELALNYLVTLHFVIASFGCYLLLKVMGAKKWSAFAASLVFAFSGALAIRAVSQTVIFFALAFVPYPLYFYIKYRTAAKGYFRDLVLAGLSLGFILLIGHIQPFFHALLALAVIELVFLYQRYKNPRILSGQFKTSIKNAAVVGLAAGAIAFPQLWVSASALPTAYRVQATGYVAAGNKIKYEEFAKSFNLDPHEFANMVDPTSYPIKDGNEPFIGLAPLALIIMAVVLARARMKKTDLWKRHGLLTSSLLILSFVAMLGYVTWFAVVLYKIPLVYQIRQLGRYVILFDLSLAIIFAASLESLEGLKLEKKQRSMIAGIGVFMLLQFTYLYLLRRKFFGLHLALQYGVLAALFLALAVIKSVVYRRRLLVGAVLATIAVGTVWFLPHPTADTERVSYYDQPQQLIHTLDQTNGRYRVGIEDNALPVNIGNVSDFQTTAGYSATIAAPFYQFTREHNLDKNFTNDILGVRLLVTKSVTNTDKVIYSDPVKKQYIVDRPTALPKMFVTTKPGSTNRNDYKGLAVTTKSYSDEYQKYLVDNPTKGSVIISELFYPGWTAKVDGSKVDMQDYAIDGVHLLKELSLPSGMHTVELQYKAFKFF